MSGREVGPARPDDGSALGWTEAGVSAGGFPSFLAAAESQWRAVEPRLCNSVPMLLRSLTDLQAIIRSAWSAESCDPVDLKDWTAQNPARGQCAVTALVVQDVLGGELLLADVLNEDGSRQGVHYWNRLAGGLEIDLTREQFKPSEVVQTPRVVDRPDDLSPARLYPQYRALADAIQARLGADIDLHASATTNT